MGNIDASLAVVSYIAKSAGQNGKLGKKAAQKLVHLISVLGKVPVKYQFQLYTYGPFSRELAGDLDVLDSLQALKITYNPDRSSYEIQAGPKADDLINKYSSFIDERKDAMDSIILKFGGRLAKELELTSMLLFIIQRNLVDEASDDEAVISKFSEIKPHYKTSEIRIGLEELRKILN